LLRSITSGRDLLQVVWLALADHYKGWHDWKDLLQSSQICNLAFYSQLNYSLCGVISDNYAGPQAEEL
jgi:hypothetical protein